jgi:hypothetical protein
MPAPTPRVRILPSQTDELAVACRLGKRTLNSLADTIEGQRVTIRQKRLAEIIETAVGAEDGKALTHLLLGLSATVSRDASRISGLLDGITNTINSSLRAWL